MGTIHFEWRNQPQDVWIGGKHCKFRSKQEYKYAKYLELLKMSGEIVDWDYEPVKFDFKERHRKRGQYTPDFRVQVKVGKNKYRYEFHEVKTSLRQKDNYRFKQMFWDCPAIYMVLVLNSCPKKNRRQLELIDQARKYVEDVIFVGPILRTLGIK